MQSLNVLIQEAESLIQPSANVAEVHRVLQICNACRYCEGFCATFQSMTRRIEFKPADIHFMANLCHNCGACFHACQYAPPHEFGVNIPQAMAKVRLETYQTYAYPAFLGNLYKRSGLSLAVTLITVISVFFLAFIGLNKGIFNTNMDGDFYSMYPHNTLAVIFSIPFIWMIVALGVGVTKFWREVSEEKISGLASVDATKDILSLKNLGGGHQEGCNDRDDAFSLWRRRYHHLTFYGFMLCLASTSVATIFHYVFAWEAPYSYFSLPVILGTLGGIGLVVGPVGLLYLNIIRHPLHGDANQKPMDRGFIIQLLLISISGLALLALRHTEWMWILLSLHMACVLSLFLLMPYGKFAHGIFRSASLLKNAIEVREKKSVSVGGE